jgi:hypothetical protein
MTREITDMPRDQYVERCKQQALYHLDQGDLVNAVASIITTMDARTDCELPEHLESLVYALVLTNDAAGLRVLIEALK